MSHRIDPALPASAYTTYQIFAPADTHWREVTCEEAGCPQQEHGWVTRIREESDVEAAAGHTLGRQQGFYIRYRSGRRFTEHRTADGLTEFVFEPGQRCFGQHRVRTARPEYFLRRAGDWRGDPTGRRPFLHTNPEHWVEDFALNQINLSEIIQKG